MKHLIPIVSLAVLTLFGCARGPSPEELKEQKEAAQDLSRNPNIENMPPEMRQQWLDKAAAGGN